MKQLFLQIAFLLILQIGYTQNDTFSTDNQLSLKPYFSIGCIYPIEFGSTALSEGHTANIGVNSSLGILRYSNFSAGFGIDFVSYSVKNEQIIGDFERSNHYSCFGFINYDYPIGNKVSLTPSFGYGVSELSIRKNKTRRGMQDGKEIRLGTSINYNFNQHNALCLSILYVNNRYDVNTNEAVKDYFGKSNSIQIGILYRLK
jgi:hypothetical protein